MLNYEGWLTVIVFPTYTIRFVNTKVKDNEKKTVNLNTVSNYEPDCVKTQNNFI